MSAPPASALTALLTAYVDPALPQAGRLVDVPASVAVRCLRLLPADLADTRFNLVRPPMAWLVTQAAELPGARLTGSFKPGRSLAVFDGIQVDAPAAGRLAGRVATDWPATGDLPAALESATAEAWTSWRAAWPTWSGPGNELLTRPLPADVAVVGLWWD